jgi:hypothetical protein
MDFSLYTDTELHKLMSDIGLVSTTSPLILNSQPMQECVARLGTKDVALTKATKKVDDDRANLRADLAVEAQARTDLVGEARTYVSLVQNNAKSPADVEAAGLKSRPEKPQGATLDPTPPDQLVEKRPKKGHGKTVVAVVESGPIRHEYVAESSLDGVTFTQLGVGHGKTRVVTGASGTKVWARFAMVKSGKQSGWSNPLIVTLP